MNEVRLGQRLIAPSQPCFVIAEGGVNHNGRTDLAHKLVSAAHEAGADAVKFQAFNPDLLVSTSGATAEYQRKATGASTQRELLASLVLPPQAWTELASQSAELGIEFICTAFDEGSAELIASLGVKAMKIPSGELDNHPFIGFVAGFGLPLLISTGMGTESEVAAALGAAAGAPSACVLHCVTAYPSPPEFANLRAIPAMHRRFGVPVGWSDHTTGHESAIASIALGACLIERHLTLDRDQPGPDHAASDTPDEFARLVRSIRTTEAALGDGVKRPQPPEIDNRYLARRSLHARRPIAAGTKLTEDLVVRLRPADGLPPATDVTSLTVTRNVEAGQAITPADVSEATK